MEKIILLMLCTVSCNFVKQQTNCDESQYVIFCDSIVSKKSTNTLFFVEKENKLVATNQVDYTNIEHKQYSFSRRQDDNSPIMFCTYDYGEDNSQIVKYYLRNDKVVGCYIEKRALDISCGNSEKDILVKALFFLCDNFYHKYSEQRMTIDGKELLVNCEMIEIDTTSLFKTDNIPLARDVIPAGSRSF